MTDDRSEIANLIERYCWTVDRQQWDAWLQCFTDDGIFDVRGKQHKGHAPLKAYVGLELSAFALIRHLVHQPMIEVSGPTDATARCYFELRGTTVKGRDFEALGSYEDQIVKTAKGWRFKLRKARFDYFAPRGEAWTTGGDPK